MRSAISINLSSQDLLQPELADFIEEQAQKLLEQESKLIQLLRIEAEALEHTPER